MAKLAFMTIGLLQENGDDPRMQGFWDRVGSVFDAAEEMDGFLGRAVYNDETGSHTWGEWVAPVSLQDEAYTNRRPATLSLWQNLESVFAFAYRGLHAEALGKRREWFEKIEMPGYVAWWVDDDHTPGWQEASGSLKTNIA